MVQERLAAKGCTGRAALNALLEMLQQPDVGTEARPRPTVAPTDSPTVASPPHRGPPPPPARHLLACGPRRARPAGGADPRDRVLRRALCAQERPAASAGAFARETIDLEAAPLHVRERIAAEKKRHFAEQAAPPFPPVLTGHASFHPSY